MKTKVGSLKDQQNWYTFSQTHLEKREKTQISKIRNEKAEGTTDTSKENLSEYLQRIIRDCCKQLYANKMDNTEDTVRFLQWYNLPRLNQEEIENINKPITCTKIETVINKLPEIKNPGPYGFTVKFCQTLWEELTPILMKLFQKIAEGGTLPSSFYEATITLIPKPDKDTSKKVNYRPVSLIIIDAKNPQENISKLSPTIY